MNDASQTIKESYIEALNSDEKEIFRMACNNLRSSLYLFREKGSVYHDVEKFTLHLLTLIFEDNTCGELICKIVSMFDNRVRQNFDGNMGNIITDFNKCEVIELARFLRAIPINKEKTYDIWLESKYPK